MLGLNFTLGSKQVPTFWEVKGEVLQHVQPRRLIGNGVPQVAPSAAEPDSRVPTAASHGRAALAHTPSPRAGLHHLLLQVPPWIRWLLERSLIATVC